MVLIFGGIGLCLTVWMVWFVFQVMQNIALIRAGRPTAVEQREQRDLEASISSHMANAKVSQADLDRLERGVYPAFGNPSAPIHVVEFVDYECPYSRQVSSVFRDMMRARSEDVYVVVRDFPISEIHPNAEHAALAANCVFTLAGREAYWKYFDRLFATQGSHQPDQLRAFALQAGIEPQQFDRCIGDAANTARIQRSLEDGLSAGVIGTPTFFINGYRIQGALSATAMDIALKQASQQKSQP